MARRRKHYKPTTRIVKRNSALRGRSIGKYEGGLIITKPNGERIEIQDPKKD